MYLFITISGKAQADTAVLSDGRTFQKSHVAGIHEMIQIITDQPAPHRHCMCPGVILLMSLHAVLYKLCTHTTILSLVAS